MKAHHIRTVGLIVGLVAVLGMASIAASDTLSDRQLTSQIPAGTRLMVGLDDQLDTGENKDGDIFGGYLDAAVTVDGKTVLERGTKVYGRVREVEKAGRFRGKAEFDLEITDVRVADELVPVVTENVTIDGEKAKTLQKAGIGAAAGAAVGAVVGGGSGAARGAVLGAAGGAAVQAITGGKQVVLKPETLLEFRTTQPLSIKTSD